MPKVNPFHTDSPEYPPMHRDVYHDNLECAYAREIESWHRIDGDGGRPRCDECIRMAAEGR